MDQIKEPLLACPNDPDDIKPLSEVAGTKIDEVFLGSCMTNIGHFRAAGKLLDTQKGDLPTRLWIAPPTKMDQNQLTGRRLLRHVRQSGCSYGNAWVFLMYGQSGEGKGRRNRRFNLNPQLPKSLG